MNATEMQAIRRVLFFSVTEAAQLVADSPERPGGVSERAWRQWESGERAVPDDVSQKLRELCAWRGSALARSVKQVGKLSSQHGEATELVLVWYARLQDWTSMPGREAILWRPQCSVLAHLASSFSFVVVKMFDPLEYEPWLGDRLDSEMLRGEWAAAAVTADSPRGTKH